ncbi:MAG: serine--tRNA ligase [Candidatus Dormibacteraceae bacterium]
MLPLELIRHEPDRVRRSAEQKGEPAPVDEILALDAQWRGLLTVAESTRAEQNLLSKEFGRSKDQSLLPKMKELAERAKSAMTEAEERKRKLDDLLLYVPNLFHESVPLGADESGNVVTREWGTRREFEFVPKTHYDLGERLGIMDFEHASRLAGSRFGGLLGAGARLQRALVQFMLDLHTGEHGYQEIYVPFLVNSEAMTGTANLPKFGGDSFRLADRDLWLIPTAEVPVTNWHGGEILDGARLPLRYVGHTPCWRSEAGAAGKDTRGYIRMHQFEKVEMVKLTTPETSLAELDALVGDAEAVLQRLQIPYQVLSMCSGDMGFAQYKKYDIEAWCPGVDRFLEVSSCSTFNDFQARRANLRFRPARGEAVQFVHTLNGSGLALPRTVVAVMENYQNSDGTITVPDVLRGYMGGLEKIG